MYLLERAFEKIGVRVKFDQLRPSPSSPRAEPLGDFALDVRRDARGEYFLVSRASGSTTEFVVLDVQPRDRHLLLLSRKGAEKHRFLLGHDERHWFVAGIPEATPVSRVSDAKQALKPELVLKNESGMHAKFLHRRANRARIRQGEWFFVPAPEIAVPEFLILHDEPLRRSGGKAHMCEQLYRLGGETVYVGWGHQDGITEEEFRNLGERERKNQNWRVMRRNPTVYVRGRVRHRDHKTVDLHGWHRVLSNTENLSYAMKNIVFLD